MSGIEFDDGVLSVDRDPNELDRLAIDVSAVLSELGVDHAFVAGYVAILAGRSRATEDIDVIVERLDSARSGEFASRLADAGFWGSAMPLSDLHAMLSQGDNIRVAREGDVIPNVELKYVSDEFDRASVENAITGKSGTRRCPSGRSNYR